MTEDKQAICDALTDALQLTRQCAELSRLDYENHGQNFETVTAVFKSGQTLTMNVSMDSGMTMIKDILKRIIMGS